MFSREARRDLHSEMFDEAGEPPVTRPLAPLGTTRANSLTGQSAASGRPTSILGPDISIVGQQLVLKTKGSLVIQGQITGDVHGESVTVESGASVTGVITARTVTIEGEVKGELKGSRIFLQNGSVVDANIVHQKLAVAEGANFEGAVKMAHDVSEVTPDLT